jgi:hypothetical protein
VRERPRDRSALCTGRPVGALGESSSLTIGLSQLLACGVSSGAHQPHTLYLYLYVGSPAFRAEGACGPDDRPRFL